MPGKAFFAENLIPELTRTAKEAGRCIMSHYRTDMVIENKDDGARISQVTIADKEADAIIVAKLKELAPQIPIVSEEGLQPEVSAYDRFWLVDPLDGTRSFIRGHGHFTVNIGLIENSLPVLGVVYDPVAQVMYWGSGAGAFRQQKAELPVLIHTRAAISGKLAALVSHSSLSKAAQAFLADRGITEILPYASSIKFCYLAEGKADLYPRFGTTMEWDTAAGHAILNAAGGCVTTHEGTPFLYGKAGFQNGGFIASGRAS